MEQPADPASNAQGQDHVSELRDRRPREHALDVGLHQRDQRAHGERGQPDDRDEEPGIRRENRIDAGEEINPRGDHRRGMNERAHRRGRFHRIRQPAVQRELRALAHRGDEETDADQRQRGRGEDRPIRQRRGRADRRIAEHHPHRRQREISHPAKQQAHADEKPHVGDAIEQKRLERRVGGARPIHPEPDEQIGTQSDQFPEDKQMHQRPADRQPQHGEDEEAQENEIPAEIRLFPHVSDGKRMHQRGDERNHRKHRDGETVHVESQIEHTRSVPEQRRSPSLACPSRRNRFPTVTQGIRIEIACRSCPHQFPCRSWLG